MEAPVSARGFRDYRDKTQSFAAVAVETGWAANLTGTGEPERVPATKVSGDWFRVLGVAPALGRYLQRDDDQPGHDHVVVLSDGLWRRLYAGEASAVGKTIMLNGEPYQIVGVMPSGFQSFFSDKADLFAPLALRPDQLTGGYTNEYLNLSARLKSGMTLARAQGEMKTFAENLKKEFPTQFAPKWSLMVRTLDDLATGRIRPVLLVLVGAVGFVLLIACANVANLLLARAAVRMKEIAIRSALGADRAALVRQLLTESVMLSVTGGALGLLFAEWGVKSVVALNPNLPRAGEVGIDGTVMVFTLVVSVVTGLLFGLAPALQTSRTNLQETLKEGGRTGSADLSGRRLRRGLVVAEVALALTLLTGAGLLIKSVARLQAVSPGFEPANVVTFNLTLPPLRYPTDTVQRVFAGRLLEQLAAVPGVSNVGTTSVLPFGGSWSTGSFTIENLIVAPGQNGPWGDIRTASPGFFAALRIPLKRGRLLDERDGPSAPPVVVIDEQFVKKYFAGVDPVGKRITFGANRGSKDSTWITVVGVVGHTAHEGLDAEPRIQLYLPYQQGGGRFMAVVVRTASNPLNLVPALRNGVHSVDRDLPLANINTMDAAARVVGRPAQADDDSARRVLGHRAAARVDRHLRRDELLRHPAHARARHSHGARRGARTRARSRREPGHGARRRRSRDWAGGRVLAHPLSRDAALLGEGNRSRHVRARCGRAHRHRATGHARSSDACNARGSRRRPQRGVIRADRLLRLER